MQEVGLVLVAVDAGEQREAAAVRDDARIMTGSDHVSTALERPSQEQMELHLAIAHHVRVRRATGPVFADHVLDDLAPILLLEVEGLERYAERRGHAQRVLAFLLPGALAGAGIGRVRPVLHEGAGDLVAFADEQSSGDARVDAAGHGDHDLSLGCGHNAATYHVTTARARSSPEPPGLTKDAF